MINLVIYAYFFRSILDIIGIISQILSSLYAIYGFFSFKDQTTKEELINQLFYSSEISEVCQSEDINNNLCLSDDSNEYQYSERNYDSICYPTMNSTFNYPNQIDVDENSILGVPYSNHPYILNSSNII